MSQSANTFCGLKPIMKKTYSDGKSDKPKKPKFEKLKKMLDGK